MSRDGGNIVLLHPRVEYSTFFIYSVYRPTLYMLVSQGYDNDKACETKPWVNEIRYLGVAIVRSVKFKCSVDQTKKSFYRAANSIIAKVVLQRMLLLNS